MMQNIAVKLLATTSHLVKRRFQFDDRDRPHVAQFREPTCRLAGPQSNYERRFRVLVERGPERRSPHLCRRI